MYLSGKIIRNISAGNQWSGKPWNFGKVKELGQWSVKPRKRQNVSKVSWELGKNCIDGFMPGRVLFTFSSYCVLVNPKSNKMVPTVFCCTISLMCKRHWIMFVLVLNKFYNWVKLACFISLYYNHYWWCFNLCWQLLIMRIIFSWQYSLLVENECSLCFDIQIYSFFFRSRGLHHIE